MFRELEKLCCYIPSIGFTVLLNSLLLPFFKIIVIISFQVLGTDAGQQEARKKLLNTELQAFFTRLEGMVQKP
jgi:uncharacterized membrane protein